MCAETDQVLGKGFFNYFYVLNIPLIFSTYISLIQVSVNFSCYVSLKFFLVVSKLCYFKVIKHIINSIDWRELSIFGRTAFLPITNQHIFMCTYWYILLNITDMFLLSLFFNLFYFTGSFLSSFYLYYYIVVGKSIYILLFLIFYITHVSPTSGAIQEFSSKGDLINRLCNNILSK